MRAPVRISIALLATGALSLGVLLHSISPASAAGPANSAGHATAHTAGAPDVMIINPFDATVAGTILPHAGFAVTVTHGGLVRASAKGTSGVNGGYSVSVPWNSGNGPGIHNGDVVKLTEAGRTYTQVVQLAGYIDEVTGLLSGTARPGATVSITLYTNGDLAHQVWSGRTSAGRTGVFSFNLASDAAPAVGGGSPWRGYQAQVAAVDVPGQEVFRPIQTPNTTLDATKDLAGGGYFWPGDKVTFNLANAGTVLASATAVADQDGIVSTTLPAAVSAGDVLRTTYHSPTGVSRTQTLDPWDLTATIDPLSGTVSGVTLPSAPVQVQYFGPGGVVGLTGRADAQGLYSLDFAAKGVTFIGNNMVIVAAIADPAFTGVGAEQVEGRTPAVSVQDETGAVTGYGTPGVHPVTVAVRAGGSTVALGVGTTTSDGAFRVQLPVAVSSGDVVEVVTGSQQLPAFDVGAGFRWSVQRSGAGVWELSGIGTPGRMVSVVVAAAGGACTSHAAVGAQGTWLLPLPCALIGTEPLQLLETATVASDGAAAGSNLLEYGRL